MSSPVSSNVNLSPSVNNNFNLIRHYKFTFFDLAGAGPFTITPVANTFVQDSYNFGFNYTVINQVSNTCKITFYNLEANVINLFAGKRNRRGFTLDIWYANNITGNTTIFRGLTYSTNTYRQGPDLITEVVGCDLFFNLLYKGVMQTFPPNTTYLSIVQAVLSYYGDIVTLNPISNQYLTGVYKTPKTIRGQLNTVLEKIAADAGLIYSLQLHQVTMVPATLTVNTPNAVQTINETNGLVGYVKAESLSLQLFPVLFSSTLQIDKNISLISLSTLMRPYHLYSKIYLEYRNFTGYYGILSVTHTGEWRGNPWYSMLILWPNINPN